MNAKTSWSSYTVDAGARPATISAKIVYGQVGAGVITDPASRERIEVDVVVFAPATPGEARRVLSLGEVKWGRTMGPAHSRRLRRAKDLLAAKGYDVRDTQLACYSGAGFDGALRSETDVRAVGLDELYG
ncbi:hypothetical protein [Nocardia sp.]|uniref:hypothetical protein n=1 Tax=Nocardia sp. TaxID=1821 RepID=UPI00258478F3|nr:hypothetical protein [Nocardia sp.]